MKKIVHYLHSDEKYSLIKSQAAENSVVLSSEKNLRTLLDSKTQKTYSFQGFYEYLLRKSPQVNTCKTLNEFSAYYIIKLIIKNTFSTNEALFNLTKSDSFSKELYKIFGEFLNADISPKDFQNALSQAEITLSDKKRLEIIAESFSSYLEILKGLNFIDKRELPKYTLELLKSYPEYARKIKQKFSIILVDEMQNLSDSEIELFDLVSDTRIHFINYFDDNQCEIPIKNDIAERAFALFEKFSANKTTGNLSKSEKIKYLAFSDRKEEAEFIAEDIISKINAKKYEFSDFSVILPNKASQELFKDIFISKNIPTNTKSVDESFQNFIVKLTRYFSLCENFTKLGTENIFENNVNTFKIQSKSKLESIFSKINLLLENIISETLENQFLKDKFSEIKENRSDLSLFYTVKNHLNILNENDRQKLISELKTFEQIFEFYNGGKITDIIAFTASKFNEKSENFNNLTARIFSQLNPLISLSCTLTKQNPPLQTVIELLNKNLEIENQEKNCVKFLGKNDESKTLRKIVYMPCLTENTDTEKNSHTQFISFDANIKISGKLKEIRKSYETLISEDKNLLKKSAVSFAKSMFTASEQLILSTHTYEDKKSVQPSTFYQFLTGIDSENTIPQKVLTIDADESLIEISSKNSNSKTQILEENEIISMSKSSISAFQVCPVKFYLKHLLKLKETSTFEANYGNIVHAIMENFNRNYLSEYSAKTLAELTEKLFSAYNNTENAFLAGFKEKDTELIKASDPLSLEEMKMQFLSAIEEMENNNFFTKIPDEVICEKSFEFKTEEISNIIFEGRVDAIYRFNDEYKIVDFKSGKSSEGLDYYISENGVKFLTKTGKESKDKESGFDYQMPIYYMASQNADEFAAIKEKVSELGMLYIRAKNKYDGFLADYIAKEKLEEFLPQITSNLKTTILDKIRLEKHFGQTSNERNCANCSYKILCDKKRGEDDD